MTLKMLERPAIRWCAAAMAAAMAVTAVGATTGTAAAQAAGPEVSTIDIGPTQDLFVQGGDAQITESLLAGRGRETLMRFDLGDLPDGVIVTEATLEMTKYHGTGGEIVISDVLGDWDASVTRETMPPIGEQIGGGRVPNANVSTPPVDVSLDVVAGVRAAVDAGETAFDLHMNQTGSHASEFRSSRAADESTRPVLSISTMTEAAVVTADADSLSSLVKNPVYTDIVLPAEGEYGSQITWSSSDPSVVTDDGSVTRPVGAQDARVTLTAVVTFGGSTETATVDVIVRGTYEVETSHPQILSGPETDARLQDLVANEDWAADSFDAIVERIEPLAERHATDPEWILSRMAMFWEEGERYTQVYIADQRFDYAEGDAPVPTLRFPAMRIWNDNKNAPLEERLPYSADGSMRNQNGDVVPYEETGHMIRLNNEEILRLAEEAAFLHHVTGEEKYAAFGADIYWQWLLGVYYMNPALDPGQSMGGPGGYEPGGNLGYYDYEVIHDPMGGQAAIVYDYLYDYLLANPDPHLDVIGKDLTEVSGEVFKRFIDIGFVRGAKQSNWNVNGWKCILDAILALESNDYYADGKGREHYLHYYTTESTNYHNALPDILLEYDQTTGLWPESPGYASAMVKELLDFAAPIYNNGIDTIGDYPMLEKAALAVGAWLDDRGTLVVFGDGRGGQPSYAPFERLNWYYQEVGDMAGAATVSTVIHNAMDAGLYERSTMSYLDLMYAAPLVDPVEGSGPSQMAYSEHHRHLVQRNGQGPDTALMATLYGGYNGQQHLTANGLAAQIYGKGWATAPQAKSYESYWSSDITYSRHEAGANTVVPGYNHGEITVNGMDPAVPEDSLVAPGTTSPWNSFADVSAKDHRRQLAIVRTSPTTGFYVDVFRADQDDSDYIWHSLGDRVELFDEAGAGLATAPADDLGSPVPTYRFFSEPEKVAHDGDLRARWTIDDGVADGADLVTDMWMIGGAGREIFTVTAPPTTIRDNLTPRGVNAFDDPTEAVIVRQNGVNAVASPFAAVYESTGSDEAGITAVDSFGEADGFTGLEVRSDDLDDRVDRVFTSTVDDVLEPAAEATFAGSYGVHTSDADGFVSAYLGAGTHLTDGGVGVSLDEPGAAWLTVTDGGYLYTATGTGEVHLPVTGDGEVTVDGQVVDGVVDDGIVTVSVAAGDGLVIEVGGQAEPTPTPTPTDPAGPVLSLSATTVEAGGSLGLTARGLVAGEAVGVELHSEPVLLESVVADAEGALATTVTIPAETAPGTHEIVLVAESGATVSAEITVMAPTAAGGGADGADGADLAVTGSPAPLGLLLLAVALVVGGGALVIMRRRHLRS
ncbi:immunoglobulin-like domain-containing protein [Microbacterium sp. SSW1-59]|uniref:immunoglobulin-like domain-containing protein n=1 Tax=Microbacterium xanthum TaxID=3079794 RepID=UPI002AD363EF|nr:immunoglobulin-like domain-containing protein [Microbacterium sp. SSW1-59]MDZ8200380.1 immunoglobulin-like domain-containing protein [Microbacterium sp. SSW1-59]